ncbi:hypothetical protein PINS_up002512 [Pythium insidiosum]|nr:hypothetical protein PINS_up002512 [Pythium insidiosum]
MEQAGISCMASGTVHGVEKYVLYAKQKGTDDFFFVSLDVVVATNDATVVIRTRNDTAASLVEQFVSVVKQEIRRLIAQQ